MTTPTLDNRPRTPWDAAWTAADGDPGPARLVAAVRRHHADVDDARVRRAWRVAARAHDGQVRQSGEPYITHPLAVALIAADLGLDEDTVVAAVLHDTVEDTAVTIDDVRGLFGDDVALLVDGVTKLDAAGASTDVLAATAAKADTLRKMLVALTDDLRVLLLKLCDRVHNMSTLFHDGISDGKRQRVAVETRDVFVPLAARLGVWQLKQQLEDLCFRALHPDEHRATQVATARTSPHANRVLAQVTGTLVEAMGSAGIPCDVAGRTKSLWSAYCKSADRRVPVDQLHDLLGARVVVGDAADLYRALGVLHATYPPVPGTFDDYVSMPKHNSYQSLHSTVMAPDGSMVEVQVRTHEQHVRAESGVASHYQYKAGEHHGWVTQLADRAADTTDPREFLAGLKADLVRGEVFVFTRDGDTVRLPSGATPIDLAYAIHTEVGHTCTGVRINGRTRPLHTKLSHGDQVEVICDDDTIGPRSSWLDSIVTPRARSEVSRAVKRRHREADQQQGMRELRLALTEQGQPADLADDGALAAVASQLADGDVAAMLRAVGTGEMPAGKLAAAIVAGDPDAATTVVLVAVDRVGLLADAAGALAELGVPILAAHTSSTPDGLARLALTVAAHEARELACDTLAGLTDVVSVQAD